jgi:hypothetical protein
VVLGFANSTCYDEPLMERLAAVADCMPDGAFFITFTRRLPSIHWEVLDKQRQVMSWGDATVFIHKKRPPFVQPEPVVEGELKSGEEGEEEGGGGGDVNNPGGGGEGGAKEDGVVA